jgi:hypothetical protein
MCGSLSLRPAKSAVGTLRHIAALIHSFILLHEALAVLPPLAQALQGAQCALLQAAGAACGHAAFAQLQGELEAFLEEDVQSTKNSFLNRQARLQGCLWLRPDAAALQVHRCLAICPVTLGHGFLATLPVCLPAGRSSALLSRPGWMASWMSHARPSAASLSRRAGHAGRLGLPGERGWTGVCSASSRLSNGTRYPSGRRL